MDREHQHDQRLLPGAQPGPAGGAQIPRPQGRHILLNIIKLKKVPNLNCQEEETREGDGEPGHGDQLPVHLALHEWGPFPGQGEREHGQYVVCRLYVQRA